MNDIWVREQLEKWAVNKILGKLYYWLKDLAKSTDEKEREELKELKLPRNV